MTGVEVNLGNVVKRKAKNATVSRISVNKKFVLVKVEPK